MRSSHALAGSRDGDNESATNSKQQAITARTTLGQFLVFRFRIRRPQFTGSPQAIK